MTASRKDQEPSRKRRPPALDPEVREQQMISLAVDVAEEQLRNGTVSAQVLSHYLKLATVREKLEREKLRGENALLEARAKAMSSSEHIEQMYKEALDAMRTYSGQEVVEDDDY